jgi:hypothetical protein
METILSLNNKKVVIGPATPSWSSASASTRPGARNWPRRWPQAISRGLTTAITDPTVPEIQTSLLACNLLMGQDEYAMRWIKAFRAREKAKQAE